MSQDSPEDTPGWTGVAPGGESGGPGGPTRPGRPGWPQADPHGRPQYGQPASGPSQPGPRSYGPQPPQHGQGQPPYGPPQPGAPQYGPPQYGPGAPYGQPPYGNQYAPPPGYQAMQNAPGPAVPGYYGQQSQSDDRTWAMLAYLLTFVGGFIAPLIVYFVKKDQSPFVRYHAAQALNLAITSAIYSIGLFVLALIAGAVSHGLGFLLILLYFPIGIIFVVYLILAAVASNRFEMYRVPGWACLQLVH